jgi:hypothetical protein
VSSLAKGSLLFQKNQRPFVVVNKSVKERYPPEQQIPSSTLTLSFSPMGVAFPLK